MDKMTGRIAERAAGLRSPKFGQIAEVRRLVRGAEGVVDLGYGEPNFMTPPHIREASPMAFAGLDLGRVGSEVDAVGRAARELGEVD